MPFDDSNLRKLLKDQTTRNWTFRSRVRDSVSQSAKSLVKHILEPDITLRLTLERVIAHEWVRIRKDRTGALVGRLVHSAPPHNRDGGGTSAGSSAHKDAAAHGSGSAGGGPGQSAVPQVTAAAQTAPGDHHKPPEHKKSNTLIPINHQQQ